MAPRSPYRRCKETSKISYPSRVLAEDALRSAQRARTRGKVLRRRESRVYDCPSCDGWHLTSQGEE